MNIHRGRTFTTNREEPEFPERFASVHDAGAFISGFVDWYNCETCFSGLGLAGRIVTGRSKLLA